MRPETAAVPPDHPPGQPRLSADTVPVPRSRTAAVPPAAQVVARDPGTPAAGHHRDARLGPGTLAGAGHVAPARHVHGVPADADGVGARRPARTRTGDPVVAQGDVGGGGRDAVAGRVQHGVLGDQRSGGTAVDADAVTVDVRQVVTGDQGVGAALELDALGVPAGRVAGRGHGVAGDRRPVGLPDVDPGLAVHPADEVVADDHRTVAPRAGVGHHDRAPGAGPAHGVAGHRDVLERVAGTGADVDAGDRRRVDRVAGDHRLLPVGGADTVRAAALDPVAENADVPVQGAGGVGGRDVVVAAEGVVRGVAGRGVAHRAAGDQHVLTGGAVVVGRRQVVDVGRAGDLHGLVPVGHRRDAGRHVHPVEEAVGDPDPPYRVEFDGVRLGHVEHGDVADGEAVGVGEDERGAGRGEPAAAHVPGAAVDGYVADPGVAADRGHAGRVVLHQGRGVAGAEEQGPVRADGHALTEQQGLPQRVTARRYQQRRSAARDLPRRGQRPAEGRGVVGDAVADRPVGPHVEDGAGRGVRPGGDGRRGRRQLGGTDGAEESAGREHEGASVHGVSSSGGASWHGVRPRRSNRGGGDGRVAILPPESTRVYRDGTCPVHGARGGLSRQPGRPPPPWPP